MKPVRVDKTVERRGYFEEFRHFELRQSPHPLLETADVVSLHVPLTDETRHLIDAKALARMKADAVLVNAARGGVVDEAAVVVALKEGRLGGCALDVYEIEPLTRDAAAHFRDVPNLVLTPHIAGVTLESNQRVSQVTMDNVRRFLEGSV